MVVYVCTACNGKKSSKEQVRKIIHKLQINDLSNTYLCPWLVLSSLGYKEISEDEEIELRLDLMSICDEVLVIGDYSPIMGRELNFADLINMEVKYYDR